MWRFFWLCCLVCMVYPAAAQVRITDTPVRIEIPTNAPLPTNIVIATPTATRTPTPEPAPMLRVSNPDSAPSINVRAEPDPLGERYGALEAGQEYVITGRYFSWLEFEYSASPSGRAWVFDQLVTVIGDEADISTLDPFAEPTVAEEDLFATGTWQALVGGAAVEQPGNAETATAQARTIELPTQPAQPNQPMLENLPPGAQLPTFTPPSEALNARPTVDVNRLPTSTPTVHPMLELVYTAASGDVPPIVPMLLLSGFGLLGMLVAVLRRR